MKKGRGMRAVPLAAALFAASAAPAASDPPAPPEGWTLSDATYTHTESGVTCPKTMGTYAFVRLDGPAEPNVLGVCIYSGGPVRVGQVRVRKYIDGAGETPLAIQNDRNLMSDHPSGLPEGAKLMGAQRMGPGPRIDGNDTTQTVLTSVHKGLLVDCISQTRRDGAEANAGFEGFLSKCMSDGD